MLAQGWRVGPGLRRHAAFARVYMTNYFCQVCPTQSSGPDSPPTRQTRHTRRRPPTPDCSHALLIDLLAAHDSAAGYGCGLEPRLLDLLIDRHAVPAGVHRLELPIRTDGPAQTVPAGWPQVSPEDARMIEGAHARR